MLQKIRNIYTNYKYTFYNRIYKKSITELLRFHSHGINICNTFADIYNNLSDEFFNYQLRPKTSIHYNDNIIKTNTAPKELAIILQGLPEEKNNLTFETIKIYKKVFPGAIIIVSTWDSVPSDTIKKYVDEGCELVINETFETCGFNNVNYQLCTTLSGLRKAKELGATYAIKNRSDLRINREFCFEYLKSLLEIFPVADNSLNTNGRIIALSSGWPQLFFPNWIHDFFFFGFTDDLINVFDIPYSDKHMHSTVQYFKNKYKTIIAEDYLKEEVPEVYITKHFLEKHIEVKDTVRFFWDIICKYYIIIDFNDINAMWNKNNRYNLSVESRDYNGYEMYKTEDYNLKFSTFLSMYTGKLLYEEWMEDVRKHPIKW